MQPHVRRHPDNSIDYDFHRRRAGRLQAEEMGKSVRGLLSNIAREVATDRLKARQRDHAAVLVRQWLKDAKASSYVQTDCAPGSGRQGAGGDR